MNIYPNAYSLVVKSNPNFLNELPSSRQRLSFQSLQSASGNNVSPGDEPSSSLKLLAGIKILTDGLLVGSLNSILFKIPAAYAIGTEVCMAIIESVTIAGLAAPNSPLRQKKSNPMSNVLDKGPFNGDHSGHKPDLAVISGLVTFAGDALVTGLSFLKSKGKTPKTSPLKRFHLIKKSKALQTLCEKSSVLIGASLLGSLVVGYLEGFVSKHLARASQNNALLSGVLAKCS